VHRDRGGACLIGTVSLSMGGGGWLSLPERWVVAMFHLAAPASPCTMTSPISAAAVDGEMVDVIQQHAAGAGFAASASSTDRVTRTVNRNLTAGSSLRYLEKLRITHARDHGWC